MPSILKTPGSPTAVSTFTVNSHNQQVASPCQAICFAPRMPVRIHDHSAIPVSGYSNHLGRASEHARSAAAAGYIDRVSWRRHGCEGAANDWRCKNAAVVDDQLFRLGCSGDLVGSS